jgi:hypothetical protein
LVIRRKRAPYRQYFRILTLSSPPPKLWEQRDTAHVIGFTKDTIFSEGNDGAHDLCRSVKNLLLKNGSKQAQWKQLFQEILSRQEELNPAKTKAPKLAQKMAKTDPKSLDGWKGQTLYEDEISAAWSGAYQVFGGAWKAGVSFDKQTSSAME